MKTLSSLALAALVLTGLPAAAAPAPATLGWAAPVAGRLGHDAKPDERGDHAAALAKRGRGRGGDDDGGHDRDDHDDDRGGYDDGRDDGYDSYDDDRDESGRDRPRIPGGSGCDDPYDLIEHPECRG